MSRRALVNLQQDASKICCAALWPKAKSFSFYGASIRKCMSEICTNTSTSLTLDPWCSAHSEALKTNVYSSKRWEKGVHQAELGSSISFLFARAAVNFERKHSGLVDHALMTPVRCFPARTRSVSTHTREMCAGDFDAYVFTLKQSACKSGGRFEVHALRVPRFAIEIYYSRCSTYQEYIRDDFVSLLRTKIIAFINFLLQISYPTHALFLRSM